MEKLIDRLADDLRPTPRFALERRLFLISAAGLLIAAVLMVGLLGMRPDLAQAATTPMFWVKSAYTFGLGMVGAWASERLSRPGASARWPLAVALVIVTATAIAGAIAYALSPAELRQTIVWGSSAPVCPLYIVGLSLPVLGGALVAMRRLAPTRLDRAGAAAGLMAGALGAWVYSFHCTESGLPFLALWYTLGIAIMAAVGALLGRLCLRW